MVDEPLIALNADQILVNKGLATVTPYEVYFMKKTKGGVISRKKLVISMLLECTNSFAVTTDNAQVVLPYTADLEVDVYATLSPSMSFTTTGDY